MVQGWWKEPMDNKYYKAYIEKLINLNPVYITLERNIKTPVGLGGYEYKKKYIDVKGLFYDRSASREIINDIGKTYANVTVTKLLIAGDADIKVGDTFTANDLEYRVVYPKEFGGLCLQVELEVVKWA